MCHNCAEELSQERLEIHNAHVLEYATVLPTCSDECGKFILKYKRKLAVTKLPTGRNPFGIKGGGRKRKRRQTPAPVPEMEPKKEDEPEKKKQKVDAFKMMMGMKK